MLRYVSRSYQVISTRNSSNWPGRKAATTADELLDALEAPTPQQITEAERAYQDIMTELYGEDYATRDEAEAEGEVKDAVDQLNYDLPRITSLAGDRQTRVSSGGRRPSPACRRRAAGTPRPSARRGSARGRGRPTRRGPGAPRCRAR